MEQDEHDRDKIYKMNFSCISCFNLAHLVPCFLEKPLAMLRCHELSKGRFLYRYIVASFSSLILLKVTMDFAGVLPLSHAWIISPSVVSISVVYLCNNAEFG